VSVPIVRLLESPSLADFAGILLEQVEGRDPDGPAPQRPLRVALQAEGSRRPFFCVHPGALEVQCYEPLARALGREQPFWALQPAELDSYGSEMLAEGSLEEAAARCVQSLREVQPSGPYFLGGWSMGGVLAWMVGQRLAAEGEEVARLVLLDSPAPPAGGEAPDDYDEDRLRPVFASYLGARQGALPSGETQLLDLLRVFKAGLLRSVRQLWACRPGTVPFPITLLRPRQALGAFDDLFPDPAARWADLTSADLEVRRVPGDHYTLFLPEHAEELAAEMRRSLV
jgi:thioesterase domain-containing protein